MRYRINGLILFFLRRHYPDQVLTLKVKIFKVKGIVSASIGSTPKNLCVTNITYILYKMKPNVSQ